VSRRRLLALAVATLALIPAAALAADSDSVVSARGVPSASVDLQPVRVVYRQMEGAYLKGPRGVFVDPTRHEVYVADTMNDLVVVYDRDGVPRFAFGYNGEFKEPMKAVADDRGRIYVLVGIGRKLKIFSYRGEFIEDFSFPGLDKPAVPTAMTMDARGNLYVADSASAQVLVYDHDRRLVLRLGGPADRDRFQAVEAIAVDRDGNIYVADARAVPLQVFAPDGTFLRGWGRHEMGPQNFSLPSGITVDGAGRVIVVDTLRQVLSMFTGEGEFLGRFSGFGSQPGAVAFPTDVAADGEGRIYVVERVGNRLQILEERAVATKAPAAPRQAPDRLREEMRRSLRDLTGAMK
jgi:DNA-binding beta-propeller fold protein YncE